MKCAVWFICFVSFFLISSFVPIPYDWKLSKNKDGIMVYLSDVKTSNFKAIKVECTLDGDLTKFITTISNVSLQKDWVYNNKTSYLIKTISPDEFYYYMETSTPWPVSNRDAVVHVKISRDSLDRSCTIIETSEPDYIPAKSGIVRVPRSTVSWYATMPTKNTVSVVYILDADPGGSLPAWLVNIFLDKGPFESFKKLVGIFKTP